MNKSVIGSAPGIHIKSKVPFIDANSLQNQILLERYKTTSDNEMKLKFNFCCQEIIKARWITRR